MNDDMTHSPRDCMALGAFVTVPYSGTGPGKLIAVQTGRTRPEKTHHDIAKFRDQMARVLNSAPMNVQIREENRDKDSWDKDSNSWHLCAAVTIGAAEAGVDWPSWVVSSGSLPGLATGDLRLGRTGRIADKIRVCLTDLDTTKSIIDRYVYPDAENAETRYGRCDHRAKPGDIRLFLTSTDIDHSDLTALGAKMDTLALNELRCRNWPELRRWIEGHIDDGLLLVQMQSLRQPFWAFYQGYYDQLCSQGLSPEEAQVRIAWIPRQGGIARATKEYVAKTRSQVVDDARRAIDREHGLEAKLRIIGETARYWLNCSLGHFRVWSHSHPDYLHVVTNFGESNVDYLLLDLPGRQGMVGKVVVEQKTILAATFKEFDKYAKFVPPGENERPYRTGDLNRLRAYLEYRERLGSIAVFPLLYQGGCLGVLCLSRYHEETFPPLFVEVVEALAELASEVLANYQSEEKLSYRQLVSGDELRFFRLVQALDPADPVSSMWTLGEDLATRARSVSRARRVRVHFRHPIDGDLRLVGSVGSHLDNGLVKRHHANLSYAGQEIGYLELEYGAAEEDNLMGCTDAIMDDLNKIGLIYAEKAHHLLLMARAASFA